MAKTPEQREHARLYNLAWRRANADWCRERQRKYNNPERLAAWRAANPEKYQAQQDRARQRRRLRRGIKDAPADTRSGECPICGRVGPLVVDHDHGTGEIRGWLCKTCNRGLGLLGDTVDSINKTLAYLTAGRPTC